jgi:hypothetical protein
MDKNQISQGTHAGVLSTFNRQLFWARFFLLALFLALSLASLQPRASVQAADQTLRRANVSIMSLQPKASAQAAEQTLRANKAGITSHQPRRSAWNCPHCEADLVACLAGGGGSSCGAQYDACLSGCH